jgi:hypothetical protein
VPRRNRVNHAVNAEMHRASTEIVIEICSAMKSNPTRCVQSLSHSRLDEPSMLGFRWLDYIPRGILYSLRECPLRET